MFIWKRLVNLFMPVRWIKTSYSHDPWIQHKSRGGYTTIMLFESYTSVSRLISMEPSELLHLRLSEPIASESVLTAGNMNIQQSTFELAIKSTFTAVLPFQTWSWTVMIPWDLRTSVKCDTSSKQSWSHQSLSSWWALHKLDSSLCDQESI